MENAAKMRNHDLLTKIHKHCVDGIDFVFGSSGSLILRLAAIHDVILNLYHMHNLVALIVCTH